METIRKVGDSITIKSLKWYEENKDENERILPPDDIKNPLFNPRMKGFCGKTFIISEIQKESDGTIYYRLEGDEDYWSWMEWMIEEEIERDENLSLVEDLLKSLGIEDYIKITHIKSFDPNEWIQATTTKELSLWWNIEGDRILVIRKVGIFSIN